MSTNVNINQNSEGCGCFTAVGLGCGIWLFAPFILAALGAVFWGLVAAIIVIAAGYALAVIAGLIMSALEDD